LTERQRGTKKWPILSQNKNKNIKTNLERENPNKPPKEDGITDTPLQMKKRFKNISG